MKRERKWMPKSGAEAIPNYWARSGYCGVWPDPFRTEALSSSAVGSAAYCVAHSWMPRQQLPSIKVNCILKATRPPLGSPHLMTAWCRNSGWVPSENSEGSPWFQSPVGFGWDFEGLQLRCSSTSPSVKSCSLHFLTNVVPETTAPKHLLHVTLPPQSLFPGKPV